MQLSAKELLKDRLVALAKLRSKLNTAPTLALIWVGNDPQTAIFIHRKQALAKKLDCQFSLHHFDQADQKQLEAVLSGLNRRTDIHGIVLQLPLPEPIDTERLISQIDRHKDVDNLRGDSPYDSPTVLGIIALLRFHQIPIEKMTTVILGAGKLVGAPLAKVFAKNNWPLTVIARQARRQAEQIKTCDLLISATGVKDIVLPTMVNPQMTVVDGSGVDIDVETIEPLVKTITPARGAIGPLTVSFLFENLLRAAAATQKSSLKHSA